MARAERHRKGHGNRDWVVVAVLEWRLGQAVPEHLLGTAH
jgi:hypothetical protein